MRGSESQQRTDIDAESSSVLKVLIFGTYRCLELFSAGTICRGKIVLKVVYRREHGYA
jgi:hypothetical protein